MKIKSLIAEGKNVPNRHYLMGKNTILNMINMLLLVMTGPQTVKSFTERALSLLQ